MCVSKRRIGGGCGSGRASQRRAVMVAVAEVAVQGPTAFGISSELHWCPLLTGPTFPVAWRRDGGISAPLCGSESGVIDS
jgi:hypothetical protein